MSTGTTTYARDIKSDLIEELQKVTQDSSIEWVCAHLTDIIRQLSQDNVTVTVETVRRRPAYTPPAYNPETDGDYSAWLAFNNID